METFLDSVARAFEHNREALPAVEVAILLLLGLAVGLQLAGVLRRRRARRSGFHRLLAGRGVSDDDLRYAVELAARSEVEPLRLVTHLDLFEHATARALDPGAPGAEAAARRIRRLRRALGYDRLPAHAPLLSTRELTPGTAVDVAGTPGTITEVDEQAFTVEVRERPGSTVGGQVGLTLNHAREARYTLDCRLAAAQPRATGGWLLRLEHDEQPARQQQRAYARVEVDTPVALRPEASWPGLAALHGAVEGRLVDLSGGGAKAVSPVALPVGSLVHLAFQVGRAGFEDLLAVVLSSEPAAEGRRQLQLEFTGRPGPERERLVVALVEHELQLRAADRTAAPPPGSG
jgi:hypothetical protein